MVISVVISVLFPFASFAHTSLRHDVRARRPGINRNGCSRNPSRLIAGQKPDGCRTVPRIALCIQKALPATEITHVV